MYLCEYFLQCPFHMITFHYLLGVVLPKLDEVSVNLRKGLSTLLCPACNGDRWAQTPKSIIKEVTRGARNMHGCSRQAITGRGGKFPASHTFNNSLEIFYPFLGLFPTSLLLGDLILQCCFSCLSLLSDTSPLIFEVFNSFLDLLFTLLHQAYQTFKTTRFIRELGLLFGKLTGKVLNFGQSLGELMGLG